MSEFTDDDRERATLTLTLLEQHISRSDERHTLYTKTIDDHEIRIRATEKIAGKAVALAGMAGLFAASIADTVWKKLGGG